MRPTIAVLVALLLLSAPPARADEPARVCAKCAEPAGNPKWRFCPICGAALPAPVAAKPPAVELAPEADFNGNWEVRNGVFRSKTAAFRLTVPNDKWIIVGDPVEVLKTDRRVEAQVLLFHEGGISGIVLAQRLPDVSLETYALHVPPTDLVRGQQLTVENGAGALDGRPFVRREYKGKLGDVESRYFQFVAGAAGMKYQLIIRGPAAAMTPEIRKEILSIQDSLTYIGRRPAPMVGEADFPGATIVQGDTFKDKENDFKLTRPGADWKFRAKSEELKDYPAETAVALEGPDGLFAVVMVVKSTDDLETFAGKVAPDLANPARPKTQAAEVDGKRALRVEHRGRSGDAVFTFVQLLTGDGAGRRHQLTVWGPTESVDKHRKAVAALEDGFHFLGMGGEK